MTLNKTGAPIRADAKCQRWLSRLMSQTAWHMQLHFELNSCLNISPREFRAMLIPFGVSTLDSPTSLSLPSVRLSACLSSINNRIELVQDRLR
jgi:hypothetical protein